MEWNFNEKETYTLEDVQAIVEGFKTTVEETIATKDETITELNSKVEKVEELQEQHKDLSIKNLMLQNNIDEELIDLVADEDLEKVQSKIDKLKKVTKENKIDNSFNPDGKGKGKSEDQYEKALKEGDIEGSLKYKLGKLFQ